MVLLWVAFSFLAGAAVLWMLRPLMRAAPPTPGDAAARAAGYRGALAALERDQNLALIAADAAASERAVIARALIAETARAPAPLVAPLPRWLSFGVIGLMPLVALGLYLTTGLSDGKPSAQIYREKTELEGFARKYRARIAAHPTDAEGYRLLAVTEALMGRYDDAAKRYETVLSLGPRTSFDLTAHAELLGHTAGNFAPQMQAELDEAITLDPDNSKARFDRAELRGALGDFAGAREDWLFLADTAPPGNPWKAEFVSRAEEALRAQKRGTGAPGAGDPQAAMIQGMVDSLAARLEANPQDLQGWLRLIHSYVVLGERDKAGAAQKRARGLFGGDPKAAVAIDAAAGPPK
jgi:cytochrome c-type biogenesis protein CcmH